MKKQIPLRTIKELRENLKKVSFQDVVVPLCFEVNVNVNLAMEGDAVCINAYSIKKYSIKKGSIKKGDILEKPSSLIGISAVLFRYSLEDNPVTKKAKKQMLEEWNEFKKQVRDVSKQYQVDENYILGLIEESALVHENKKFAAPKNERKRCVKK